jgi:membrane dipeptidase
MIVIDSHLDLAWNALNWNRDLTLSVDDIRRSEAGISGKARGRNTVAFPEMQKGDVAISLATVLARASSLRDPMLDYRTQEIAYAMAQGQLAYYRVMQAQGRVRLLRNWADVESHLAEWEKPNGISKRLGFILSMEGADPIVSPDQLLEWWNDGLRVVGLVHYGVNAYAHGTGAAGGLTAKGRDLLKAMEQVGVVLDATHLADESFWQAVESFKGPVLASHNNCRALVPGVRQFSDDQLRHLIERGSVIGVAFDAWMLYPGWVFGKTPNSTVSLEAVIAQIDHICELAGNSLHVAIGTDLDGGFGTEQSPHDLDTIADLQKIPGLLSAKGYREADVKAIMHGNWLRFFREAWPGT